MYGGRLSFPIPKRLFNLDTAMPKCINIKMACLVTKFGADVKQADENKATRMFSTWKLWCKMQSHD